MIAALRLWIASRAARSTAQHATAHVFFRALDGDEDGMNGMYRLALSHLGRADALRQEAARVLRGRS